MFVVIDNCNDLVTWLVASHQTPTVLDVAHHITHWFDWPDVIIYRSLWYSLDTADLFEDSDMFDLIKPSPIWTKWHGVQYDRENAVINDL